MLLSFGMIPPTKILALEESMIIEVAFARVSLIVDERTTKLGVIGKVAYGSNFMTCH